jgi:hypothetical protein
MMTETEVLLTEFQAALTALDAATSEHHASLRTWADLKTRAQESTWAAERVPAALQKVRECEGRIAECRDKVKSLDYQLAVCQQRRCQAGVMTAGAH